MQETFENSSRVRCTFSDSGVTFGGEKQEIFYPFSRIERIDLSLLGVLTVSYRARFSTFAVDRKDRAAVKQLVKETRERMKNAPEDEIRVTDLTATDSALSPEEQLKALKAKFIQGAISKEEYDATRARLRGN